ncbi:MFS transporter [Xenorhabdus sp. PB62.4]|uniref:MFS transporter n=1 Tax=Xenorhabdus sp. PB62.4 TaxID=1851573 RepID=UPI00165720AD|nr:MFS transporter [Xenorhabdus sp. PB62.4]MBC8952168.1 hypothetical protein [Xenorhabdus sp. PB62.4]
MVKRIPFQIRGLLALNGVSILGNAITEIAIPWLILEISGSPLLVATVMSAKILPLIFSIFLTAFRYIKSEKALFAVLIISSVVNFVITPFLVVYLPYVNKQEFNSVLSLGVSMTCFGIGTTLSSLLYGVYGKYFSSNRIIFSGYSLFVLFLISMNLFSGQYVLFIQLFAIGMCIGFSAPVEVTLIQRQVPEKLFGRIMTLFSSTRFLAVPVGYLCFGTVLESDFAKQTPLMMAVVVLGGLAIYGVIQKREKSENDNFSI